ncbi:2126_t:CDS:2, partial [Racocetra fulgida]
MLDNSLLEVSPIDNGRKIQKNNQLFNDSIHLKPTIHSPAHDNNSESAPVCNIEYRELSIIRFISSGGFSDVYKGLYKKKFVAAKFVSRGNPTQLRDFDREVHHKPNLPIIVVEDYTNKLHDESFTNNMQICSYTTAELKQAITIESFKPLFESVCQLEKNWMQFCNVQLNGKISEVLGECIMETKHNVEKLKKRKSNIASFATLENYRCFQRLLQNITDIKDFICNISQIGGLTSYIQETDHGILLDKLKDKYDELLKEFKNFITEIKNAATNDSIFADLPIDSLNEPKNDGNIRVEKYCYSSDSHETNMLRIQITLLKNLEGSIHIHTEWSNYGNLKMYYNQYKPLNISIKINIAFDICNGLVFLNAVNFLHRNIRSENILITNDHRAKLTNFCYSRLTANDSRKINLKDTGIEYVAPEILER